LRELYRSACINKICLERDRDSIQARGIGRYAYKAKHLGVTILNQAVDTTYCLVHFLAAQRQTEGVVKGRDSRLPDCNINSHTSRGGRRYRHFGNLKVVSHASMSVPGIDQCGIRIAAVLKGAEVNHVGRMRYIDGQHEILMVRRTSRVARAKDGRLQFWPSLSPHDPPLPKISKARTLH
jgi:hypothetical protein